MSKKDLWVIMNAMNKAGYGVVSRYRINYCRGKLTDLTLEVTNDQGDPIKVYEDGEKLVALSKEIGYFIIPHRESKISNLAPFTSSTFKLIKQSHMEDIMALHLTLMKQLKDNYWVIQGNEKAVGCYQRFGRWGVNYAIIFSEMKKMSKDYDSKLLDYMVHEEEKFRAAEEKIAALDSRMKHSGYFSKDEQPIDRLYL